MDKLETDSGFLTTIYLNESKAEYKSMTRSYKKQNEEMFFPKGQSLTATGVAHGDPFHFQVLMMRRENFSAQRLAEEMCFLTCLQKHQQDFIIISLPLVKWDQENQPC